MCTGISVNQTINAHQHASPFGQILQAVDPGAVIIGLLDSHWRSVAQRLHHGKHAENSCLWRLIGIEEGLAASPSHTTGRTRHVSGGSMKQIPTAAQGSVVPFGRRSATGARSTASTSATPAMNRVRTCGYATLHAPTRRVCAVADSPHFTGMSGGSPDKEESYLIRSTLVSVRYGNKFSADSPLLNQQIDASIKLEVGWVSCVEDDLLVSELLISEDANDVLGSLLYLLPAVLTLSPDKAGRQQQEDQCRGNGRLPRRSSRHEVAHQKSCQRDSEARDWQVSQYR